MADPGDRLAARYRELASDEPPPALDAAILAASRRAAGSRPGRAARWAGPVSIAAVLVLGLSISLRMQVETPGIETSSARLEPEVREKPLAPPATPTESAQTQRADVTVAPAPALEASKQRARASAPQRDNTAPASPIAPRAAPEAFTPSPPADATVRPGLAKESVRPSAPMADAMVRPGLAKESVRPSAPMVDAAGPAASAPIAAADAPVSRAPAPAPLTAPAPPQSAAPAPARISTPATAAAPPPPPAPAPRGFALESGAAPQAASRPVAPAAPRIAPAERREAPAQSAAREAPIPDAESAKTASPEAQLERIARLREAKRDEEADRALDEFRRRHPDYRIPAAVWERVRSR